MPRGDYCICLIQSFGSVLQAWTTYDLDEVLDEERYPFFLRPLFGNCSPGDWLELFQVTDLEHPERDPLAMASLIVTAFETRRDGLHMHYARTRPLLRFGIGEKEGIQEARWGGQPCVWQDGRRVGTFNTDIEANEHANWLRKAAGLPERKQAYAAYGGARLGDLPESTLKDRCRPEDISRPLPLKIAPILEMRVLAPIEDVMRDPRYFSRVSGCLGCGRRCQGTGQGLNLDPHRLRRWRAAGRLMRRLPM